jgi:hypothetical protein
MQDIRHPVQHVTLQCDTFSAGRFRFGRLLLLKGQNLRHTQQLLDHGHGLNAGPTSGSEVLHLRL